MEELDEEKFIISKEDFEYYFCKNSNIDKNEILRYYNKKEMKMHKKNSEQIIQKINYFLTT